MCEEETSLATDQEEADTKVFLCIKHATDHFDCHNICILTVDSDIGIYSLFFQSHFPSTRIFLRIGAGNKRRILDIKEISLEIGSECCDALPALHAFTGNDYTSAFHGIGKVKAYRQMIKSQDFLKMFKALGDSFSFDSDLFPTIEQFVCSLYGVKECKDVNEARYTKFCTSLKATEPQKLPPTRDALLCHCKRVAYVTATIKHSLERHPVIPDPQDGFGWVIENGKLDIEWMLLPPAPEQVLQMITCACKKKCVTRVCSCSSHGLSCTDLCNCKNCENREKNKEFVDSESDSDDEDDTFSDNPISDNDEKENIESDLSEEDTNCINFSEPEEK